MAVQVVCVVSDTSGVGSARRMAQGLALDCGFSTTDAARVALVATELANNLVRHAGGGRLLLQALLENGKAAIELLSIDTGPGMQDVAKCLRDGYSSGGTSGTGLGAVQRTSSAFEVFTIPAKGCIVLSRVQALETMDSSSRSPLLAPVMPIAIRLSAAWRWGAVSVPAPGETVVGDSWRIVGDGNNVNVMVADGLGHGPLAAEAAEEAARAFETMSLQETRSFFDRAHARLRSTRGAAVAVAKCPGNEGALRFAGIGNISGVIVSHDGSSRGLMSHNGTVGAEMRTFHEVPYEWTAGDRLIMHSDGITSRWSLARYPGLLAHHPAIIAAVLFRDFVRGRDDATVVVLERVA